MTPLEAHQYKQHADKTYVRKLVKLDGCIFTRCHFEHCVLVFHGEHDFSLIRCSYDNTDVTLADDALRIVGTLAIRLRDPAILTLLANIRSGVAIEARLPDLG